MPLSPYDIPPGQICRIRSWWSTWCRAVFPGPGVALLHLGRWCWKVEALDCCGGGSNVDGDAPWPQTPAAPAPSSGSTTRSPCDCTHDTSQAFGQNKPKQMNTVTFYRVCNYGWWRCKRLHYVRSRKRGRSEGFGCQGVSLYLETGEDAALTLTQRPPPVDGVHRLTVEDRPVEQLHHHHPHLCVITQAGAVSWQQRLWDRFQMTVGKMTGLSLNMGGDWNKHQEAPSRPCSWRSNRGAWWLWAGKASCTPPWRRPTQQRCWTP